MGLAGVKKSNKIGLDPRNTKWINNQDGVGHKLLMAQGWTPGSGLGDSMVGRTINIKTTYKDDTAGIGCTPQHAQEWSGLGSFDDIFTRINSVNADYVAPVLDAGLKDKDKVTYMDIKGPRIGLDVRFVRGETYTSDLSKAHFLEALGISIGHQDSSERSAEKTQKKKKKRKREESKTCDDDKLEKKAKKLEKAARKAKRAEKRRLKELSKPELSSSSSPRRKVSSGSVCSSSTASADEDVPTVVVIPPSQPTTRPVHGRFASRAKYQRAKLGSRMDAAQLAEILGVKA